MCIALAEQTTARRADHQNVLRHDLLLQVVRERVPPVTIPKGNRHGFLGFRLPNDVAIQLLENLPAA